MDTYKQVHLMGLRGFHAAAIFYDFEAAFLSLAHSYLHATLEHLGIPRSFRCLVRCLCWGHGCTLVVDQQRYPGFVIESGIRQGCPLSPLLFAVVGDILLCKLLRYFPTAAVRASADDLCTVLPNVRVALRPLSFLFVDFAHASRLHFNL